MGPIPLAVASAKVKAPAGSIEKRLISPTPPFEVDAAEYP
jgi:hypothetical protein